MGKKKQLGKNKEKNGQKEVHQEKICGKILKVVLGKINKKIKQTKVSEEKKAKENMWKKKGQSEEKVRLPLLFFLNQVLCFFLIRVQ